MTGADAESKSPTTISNSSSSNNTNNTNSTNMSPSTDSEDTVNEWEPTVNGNRYSSLQETFEVEAVPALDTSTTRAYRSIHPAYGPGGYTRAFGGHVYAQAVVAASKSVAGGFAVHSITGHFLLQGRTDLPFTYHVSVIRTGESYAQRRVDVVQRPKNGTIFTAVVSFKTSEASPVTSTRQSHLSEKYAVLLRGREPDSWPEAPSIDSPFWYEIEDENGPLPFPGLDMRKVDMSAYNKSRKALDRMQLQYYRAIAPLPSITEDSALHACGHLYASDRNGLFTIPNFLGEGDAYSAIASLNHTVVFHDEPATYNMLDETTKQPKWFCVEAAIDHISHGRTLVSGKLWDVETGRPVASYMQDGLVRMKENVVQSADGESIEFRRDASTTAGDGPEPPLSVFKKAEKL